MKETYDSIARMLEVYDESWKEHHEEATLCWQLERALKTGNWLFFLICDDCKTWRRKVASGEVEYLQADEAKILDNFKNWLIPRARVERDINFFVKQGYKVEFAEEIERNFSEAERILREWGPPVLCKTPSYDPVMLSDDEAEQLRGMIDGGEAKVR